MEKKIVSYSLKDTEKIAHSVATLLSTNDTILLNGDLGVGKTTFTKFLLKKLGVVEEVTSPTFTIIKEYYTPNKVIFHCDLYRISNLEEAVEFGIEEYVNHENKLLIVEWSKDILSTILKDNFIIIDINYVDENSREFVIKGDFIKN